MPALLPQTLPVGAEVNLSEAGEWALGAPLRIVLIALGAVVVAKLSQRAVRIGLRRVRLASVEGRTELGAELGTDAAGEQAGAGGSSRSAQRLDAISSVLESGIAGFVYAIGLGTILGELGISLAPLIAGAGIAGVAIGFGAQSLVKDFFSGVFVLIEDQYAVGDIVDVGEATGTVESVSLRTTRLRAVDGVVWHVPNGEIRRVGNMSQHWSRSLLDIEVAYDTDLELAKRVIGEVATELASADEDVIGEPEVWGVEALGQSSIAIRLVVKTRPSEQWRISRELRERIKGAFDREGIEIPFPQQTVWTRDPGEGRLAAPAD